MELGKGSAYDGGGNEPSGMTHMTDEAEFHQNKLASKTYISRRIVTESGTRLRIASKVMDSSGYQYVKEKNELVVRRTPTGRKQIVAKFLEDDKGLHVVTIQSFNGNTGAPHKTYFSFVGPEIRALLTFFENIASIELEDGAKVNVTDTELRRLVVSKQQAAALVKDNEPVFSAVVRFGITKEDVVAVGYRKKQISVFSRLLNEASYFSEIKRGLKLSRDEDLWQRFFEKNQWIFGYGLSYFFVTGFDPGKLEKVVQGYDLVHFGKRVDALMVTRGLINSLCFVEIKTHETDLLEKSAYRSGCWAPSRELAGAVAQVQGTVSVAMKNLSERIQLNDKDGNPTGQEAYNFKPRSFIVVGSLKEFISEHGVNQDRLRCFELYRNSISDIEIITFDELYERSRLIVQSVGGETKQD